MEGKILKAAAQPGAIVRQEVVNAAGEARRILDEAEAARSRIREEARAEGFREGFDQWAEAIRDAQTAADRYRREARDGVLKLSVRIAEKILGGELASRPDRIAGIVDETLRNVSRERRLTIEVAMGFGKVLEENRERMEARLGHDCTLRIVETGEIAPGGCVLRSELGAIDARLETQLALLERALLAEATS